jgi:methylmalonyl-CoA mutase C-terminal domain/subunit
MATAADLTGGRRARVLIAKAGLDSHYRGAVMVARYLVDCGMEVIYVGNQLPEAIADAATQEDVDVVGISSLSGNHMVMVPRVLEQLRRRGRSDVTVVVGGVIPPGDGDALRAAGVAAVFTTGASLEDIAEFIESRVEGRR